MGLVGLLVQLSLCQIDTASISENQLSFQLKIWYLAVMVAVMVAMVDGLKQLCNTTSTQV